ncbi:hypothetical protein G8770_03740 [Aestuariicella hydrocarbonica]|uniref:Uncharacterized protein n=1 Tax=Pseudomaricurvus hydrocarbonicus TaxID=1470433 RepID=A0A9E5MLJ2_9GAMM|nr:hypothetical protein [Aestuariicella hydrocarbonica]NHO64658.1 hypothetical protein [Aestuariicella hydrocarbonica]
MAGEKLRAALGDFTVILCFRCGERTTQESAKNNICHVCTSRAQKHKEQTLKQRRAKKYLSQALERRALDVELKEVWELEG